MNINYTKNGDYLLPNFKLNKKQYNIKKYGLLKLDYIKNNKKELYTKLLMEEKLNSYLHDIDLLCEDKMNKLVNTLAEKEKVTEELKENNQILWITKMNNIKNRVEEIILKEYIYV